MPLNYEDLDDTTRIFMLEELERDISGGKLYISPRLTESGIEEYPRLFRVAIENGNDATFAADLIRFNCLKTTELRRSKPVKVPRNANETLAEGEFNRFYIRGLCRRAIEDDLGTLEVYRAKEVHDPRPESQTMIGKLLDPNQLLTDLRANYGVDTVLGLPSGPNSGLSARIRR